MSRGCYKVRPCTDCGYVPSTTAPPATRDVFPEWRFRTAKPSDYALFLTRHPELADMPSLGARLGSSAGENA